MAQTSRLQFVTLCVLFLMTVPTTSVEADHKSTVGHCFRQRTPTGHRGRCTDKIHLSENSTVSDAKECCLQGGTGWSLKSNGKRCVNACEEIHSEGPLETSYLKDTDLQNDTGNATWHDWEAWQKCTAECGSGNVTRSQTSCIGGKTCNGSSEETIPCNSSINCPDTGNTTWSDWDAWQNCTAECGSSNVTRTRICMGGNTCNGSSEETIACDSNITCPVHGGWSNWSDWSSCDGDQCDRHANKTRTRTCTNPAPSADGRPCAGLDTMSRSCNLPLPSYCPVNGAWSTWSSWGACSASCGSSGLSIRYRWCNNPSPRNGGSGCPGLYVNTQTCTQKC